MDNKLNHQSKTHNVFKVHLSLFLHQETSAAKGLATARLWKPSGCLLCLSMKMCICVIQAHIPPSTATTSPGCVGNVCSEGTREREGAALKAVGDMGDYMCIPVLIWCQTGRGQCREHAGPGSGQWLIMFVCGCVWVCWRRKEDERIRAGGVLAAFAIAVLFDTCFEAWVERSSHVRANLVKILKALGVTLHSNSNVGC